MKAEKRKREKVVAPHAAFPFTYLLLFHRLAMFDGCKQDHLNVIFPQTGGKRKKKKKETLI